MIRKKLSRPAKSKSAKSRKWHARVKADIKRQSQRESAESEHELRLRRKTKVVADEIYQGLTKSEKVKLLQIQTEVRTRFTNMKRDAFAIGEQLTEAKRILPHGKFQAWIEEEFQNELPYCTANFYMKVYETFKDNFMLT